nr:MAG TPA: hypothetical protein [Caudoviricetes sp.]
MKKEKGLYVMNTEKGAFLKTAEFDNELNFRNKYDQCICNAQPLAAVSVDDGFSEHHQRYATKLAEFLSQRGDKIAPVIVEFDIKVTGLDGTEYNVDKLIGRYKEENRGSELAKLLGLLG